jgi:hypothetical protein
MGNPINKKEENTMTDKDFNKAVWAGYLNKCANNVDNHHDEDQAAVKMMFERTIRKMGCPNQDEVHDVVQNFNDFDLTPIAERIPYMVSGLMAEERMAFKLPAVNANMAPATLKVRAVAEKKNTGTIMFGPNKGQEYTSVTAAHEEVFVKNATKAFKK